MISLRSSLEKLSAGARVIFGVAALLENTPFELYTLIRSGSLIQLQAATRNASGDHEPTHDLEICRDLPRPSGLQDSPLEGAGFELLVPRYGELSWRDVSLDIRQAMTHRVRRRV